MNWLLVAAGAVVGAPLRYLVDRAVQARHGSAFPWGTFLVNAAGCLLLGLLAGLAAAGAASPQLRLFLGAGLCGALTTYSTFSYETVRLARGSAGRLAVLNAAGSLAVGLAAVYAGAALGSALPG